MEPDKKNKRNKLWWEPALELFGQMAGWLVFPILVAIFLGKWLDQKFGTDPELYFLCVGISFIITMVGLIRYSIKAMKKMDNMGKDEEDKKNKTEDK